MNSASIQETILSAEGAPSMDLWRLFQSSYEGLQDEVEAISKRLAETKVQQQRLDQAQALFAEAGFNMDSVINSERSGIKKARQEFGPTGAGAEEGGGARSPLNRSSSMRVKSLGSFANKGASAAASPKVTLKSIRGSGSGGGGGGGAREE
jgi:hypothetical protein